MGLQVVPALMVFQTPPEATATYQVLRSVGCTARSPILPEATAGPLPLNEIPVQVSALERVLSSVFPLFVFLLLGEGFEVFSAPEAGSATSRHRSSRQTFKARVLIGFSPGKDPILAMPAPDRERTSGFLGGATYSQHELKFPGAVGAQASYISVGVGPEGSLVPCQGGQDVRAAPHRPDSDRASPRSGGCADFHPVPRRRDFAASRRFLF